jgi:type IV secretory pathway VirB4 component
VANPPSTTDLIQISQITDGVIILKDGSLRAVVEINAINFELRSSEEQAAILQQFQEFLNSVDFPLQMVVHSRRFDISGYINNVRTASEQLQNELLKVQAQEYMRFVSELSELANIMSKHFYIALSFQIIQSTDEKKGILGGITGLFKKKKPLEQGISPEQLASYKAQLQQRADLVAAGISGMGLRGHLMTQEELLAMFHGLYNPIVPAPQKQSNS